ncbi:MAG TPA: PGPGW domain-containing protein [Thermoleophilaceae bacterium]
MSVEPTTLSVCHDLPMAAEEQAERPEDDRPELLIKLQERKERHKQRHIVHRAAVVALGALLIPIGIVMSGPGVPGPGFLVILLGISFLALEFDRAERLLERVIVWGDQLKDRVEASSTHEKVIAGVMATLALAAFAAWAVFWNIPLVPLL